jgi:hypothetical protein
MLLVIDNNRLQVAGVVIVKLFNFLIAHKPYNTECAAMLKIVD